MTTGWTVETLKEHLEAMLSAQERMSAQAMAAADKAVDAALAAAKEAVRAALASGEKASEKTEIALKEYKTASNEWRDTVKDLVSRMPTRETVDKDIKALSDKIQDLRETRSESVGSKLAWGSVVGLVILLIALGTFALRFTGR